MLPQDLFLLVGTQIMMILSVTISQAILSKTFPEENRATGRRILDNLTHQELSN